MDKTKRKNDAPLAFLGFFQYYRLKTKLSLDECKARLSEEVSIEPQNAFSSTMTLITVIESSDANYCEFSSLMLRGKMSLLMGAGMLNRQDDGTIADLKVGVPADLYATLLIFGLGILMLTVVNLIKPGYSWVSEYINFLLLLLAIVLPAGIYLRLRHRRRFAELFAKHLNAELEGISSQKPVLRT